MKIANGVATYYLGDSMGSVIAFADGFGDAAGALDYDGFGNARGADAVSANTAGDFRFQGMWKDPTGLYYVRARMYEAETARFTSRDPAAGSVASPESTFPYVFGMNNARVYRDPLGLFSTGELSASSAASQYLTAMTIASVGHQLLRNVSVATGRDPRLYGLTKTISGPDAQGVEMLNQSYFASLDEGTRRLFGMNYVNYDTGAIAALAAPRAYTDPASIIAAQGSRRAMMSLTAFNESMVQIEGSATPSQRAAATALFRNILIVPDAPSARVMALRYPDTKQSPGNPEKMANFALDKIIFGTGDTWRAQTFTSDGIFVKQASQGGVHLSPEPFVFSPGRFGVPK